MEPQEQPLFDRVLNGTFRSALNGAVMAGIYYGMMYVGILLHLLPAAALSATALPMALVLIGAVAVFGGVMASGILGNHKTQQQQPAVTMGRGRGIAQEPELEAAIDIPIAARGIGGAPMPIMMDHAPEMQEAAPTRNWAERPDIQAQRGRSSLEKILADGADGQSHAEAILAEQQAESQGHTIH